MNILLKPFFFVLAVIIISWENFIYYPIKKFSDFLEKSKIIHRFADKIRNSHPYVALIILMCGGLPLIPFKIAGLYLIGHGYTLLGIGTFGVAKVIGGAISIQLFNLTEPAIRKINIVNLFLNKFFEIKDKIKNVLYSSKMYIMIHQNISQLKFVIKTYVHKTPIYQKLTSFRNSHKILTNESFSQKVSSKMKKFES